MSLVYFNGGIGDTETNAIIKEKTGLELIYKSGSGGSGIYSCQVKFPDMEDYETLSMQGTYRGKSAICFVDVENHFFAYVVPQSTLDNYYPSGAINEWLLILIHEKDGKLASEMTSSSGMSMYEYCNITKNVSNILKEQITLVPLYMSMKKSFVKNLYINYERCFTPKLKFIDQNGNEFITLGGYLLYYNGKHK